ncbi:hypothetical protein HK098_001309 [Nowakowskiella sp. JEL0407]|nr:hypothetical protein HK098_001309 [Nowakowskiella sp. JEL0407]
MTILGPLTFLLPPPPPTWDQEREFKIHKKLSISSDSLELEPVGTKFMSLVRRAHHNRSLEEDESIEKALLDLLNSDETADTDEDEPETRELLRSDPLDWKNQDHYAILGLSKKRWRASDDDIKRAYRRKVLKHHPDKKRAKAGKSNDDSFFKCVQKAWEILSDPVKRRQWDSIDPKYDDAFKSVKKGEFFAVFSEATIREGRFSKKLPVPDIGTIDSSREHVENFYNFWYNFDSWRTFEMLDEEDPENCESREERRMIERQNKNARLKRKKEDNARIQRFVDQMMKADPRIAKFKESEKAAKEAKKREKEMAAKAAQEELKRKADEEKAASEKAEQEEKQRQETEKKAREAKKKLIRREKKKIKEILKEHNNLLPQDATAAYIGDHLHMIDQVLDALDGEQLEELRKNFEAAIERGEGVLGMSDVLFAKYKSINDSEEANKRQAELAKMLADDLRKQAEEKARREKVKAPWSPKEVAILIKAFKMYPGGTIDRWETIAEYVNLHGGEENEDEATKNKRMRSADECIKMSKQVQQGGAGAADRSKLQSTLVKRAQHTTEETPQTAPESTATPKSESTSNSITNVSSSSDWTPEQQSALESALKQYPASMFTSAPAERWSKIAELIEGKSKKDVKARVKELAEMVKRKKDGK